MELLDTTARVDTPERVRFRYRVAGPGPRAVAWLIDFGIRFVVLMTFVLLTMLASLFPGLGGVGIGVGLVVAFLLEWFYGMFFEAWWAGQTPGKYVLSLRVVRVDGSPAQLPDIVLRNLLRAVDYLPAGFGVGVVVMGLDSRMRRVGDLVAGTVVVIEDRAKVLAGLTIEPPVTEAERQALPATVNLSREEISLIEQFLRRLPRLSPARAEELAALYGPALSERTGVTAPDWTRVLTLAYARATGKDRE